MGLLIDDETLELLRHGDESQGEVDWVDKLVELYNSDEVKVDDSLMHYGVAHDENPPGRGSGRYPFGSGDRMLQRHWDQYSRYIKLKNSIDPETGKPYTESTIAGILGYYQTDNKTGAVKLDKKGNPLPNTSLLRAKTTIAKNYIRQEGYVKEIAKYDSRKDPDTGKPYTNTKIAELLGINESSVRNYRNSEQASKNASKPETAAKELKALVDKNGMIDIGRGSEISLDVSSQGMKVALEMLKEQGYHVSPVWIDQVAGVNGNKTIINVLYKPDVEYSDVYKNIDKIKPIDEPQGESTTTRLGIRDPVRVSLDRVKVRFAEEGGTQKDGTIEIRAKIDENGRLVAACDDLSLGNAKYAQVRIATEGDHYIKGMAVYNTDLKNCDILVNSNKSRSKGKVGALKDMETVDKKGVGKIVDPDNPFGATVFQSEYKGKDGRNHLSAINVVSDLWGVDHQHKEGAWGEWSRNLPAQFLSKQSETLIKQQLKLKVQEKQQEYEEIKRLNNPVVKKQLLKDFADECDAAAVDLKAAALPGQRVQVILPLTTIKPNEIYAPNYENGQTVALIRYPHTGPFEIPIVKVNNRNKEAKAFLEDSRGQALDAIGINSKTAAILSGADFDGDTVTVIPMTRKNASGEWERYVNIKGLGNGQAKLPDLEDFNPSDAFPGTDKDGNALPGVHLMTKREKGIEMGKISNLITDMSLKGCENPDKLSRAVRYSMVVIDAEKHKLDYKRAEKEYDIQSLREEYQDGGGVSTLVSKAGAERRDIIQRQAWTPNAGHIDKETGELVGNTIDPKTGEKIYRLAPNRFYTTFKEVRVKDPETGKYIKNPDGTWKKERIAIQNERKQSSTFMAEAKDAKELLSRNPSNRELLYADYANRMKAMGNKARKDWLAVPKMEMNSEAKKKYATEVQSLNVKFLKAKQNAPRERQAQILATQIINSRLEENPDKAGDKEWIKKQRGQALNSARSRTGALKERVRFTDKEWEAVNAGAISETRLKNLLQNADADNYRQLATPRSDKIAPSTAARIEGLLAAGWTKMDIVNAGYASMGTIDKVQKGMIES